ncbi:DUF5995 family protein [Candidatus Uabimicrobium sp. HlEnr_7]|uniref:DUF5995 family protein n=1 Tax=Candidatus Uabimicrobium helgolandensis TaxID=3095367 RepID=UPI003557956F
MKDDIIIVIENDWGLDKVSENLLAIKSIFFNGGAYSLWNFVGKDYRWVFASCFYQVTLAIEKNNFVNKTWVNNLLVSLANYYRKALYDLYNDERESQVPYLWKIAFRQASKDEIFLKEFFRNSLLSLYAHCHYDLNLSLRDNSSEMNKEDYDKINKLVDTTLIVDSITDNTFIKGTLKILLGLFQAVVTTSQKFGMEIWRQQVWTAANRNMNIEDYIELSKPLAQEIQNFWRSDDNHFSASIHHQRFELIEQLSSWRDEIVGESAHIFKFFNDDEIIVKYQSDIIEAFKKIAKVTVRIENEIQERGEKNYYAEIYRFKEYVMEILKQGRFYE